MLVDESSTIFHLPRIHTAIAQWLFCVIYLFSVRKKRFSFLPGAVVSLAFLGLLIVLNRMGEYADGISWVAYFALCMIAMLAMFMTIGVLKPREAVCHWSQAFVMAEFAASLEWQANYLSASLSDAGGLPAGDCRFLYCADRCLCGNGACRSLDVE